MKIIENWYFFFHQSFAKTHSTMNTYLEHHNIHTNHIFDFETDCYFLEPMEYQKKQTRRIISQLIEKLKVKIISSTKPKVSDSLTNIENVTVTSNHSDFDYWFALKLRQYQMRLKSISAFLNYHLSYSFNHNKRKFDDFLELVLLQYQDIFFNKKLTKIVKKYCKNALSQTERKNITNKIRKPRTDYNTFQLKALRNNPNYIKENIVSFMDTWSALKKEKFIDKHTSFENFKSIFKNQSIEPLNRIKWTGTNKELQWFVKYLVYGAKKVIDLDKDIWLITMKCFVRNNETEFTESQLRNASGNRLGRKKLVESILHDL